MKSIHTYLEWLRDGAYPEEIMVDLPNSMVFTNSINHIVFIETVDPNTATKLLMETFEPLSVVTGKGVVYHYGDGTVAKFIKCKNAWELKRNKKVIGYITIKEHFTAEECDAMGYNFYNDTIPLERCKGCGGAYYDGKDWTCEGGDICKNYYKCPYSM